MKKYILLFIFFAFFMTFPSSLSVYATSHTKTVTIDDGFQELDLRNQLEIFFDQKHVSNEKILEKTDAFVPLSKANPSGDIADTVYWLKVNVRNGSQHQRDLLLEIKKPHLSSVTLYKQREGQLQKEETIGYRYPFNLRDYKHRNLVFTLQLRGDESGTYFLKMETDSFFQAPVSLWDPIAFSESNYMNQSILGVFYGIMLAMIIYNTFLFFSLREKSYFYYILFISGFTMLQAIWDGLAFQFVWGDFPWWALRSNVFFILWSSLFALQFTRHFLQLKEHAPVLNKIVTYFTLVCALCLTFSLFMPVGIMTMVSTVIATVFLIFLIVIALKVRLRTREAKFFLSAWALLFVGVILNLLAAYKLIPLTNLTLFAPKIGGVVEVLVLSLGLADKIKRMRKEKAHETKKYYVHTLMQHSFKQMSIMDELESLTEQGLTCLRDVTHFEKGVYLKETEEGWRVVSQIGSIKGSAPDEIEARKLEWYAYFKEADEARNALGMESLDGSTLSIPITGSTHTGLFILCSNRKDGVDLSIMDSILPSFIGQFTALIDQKEGLKTLKRSAMIDHLTKIYNRKYFLEKANELHEQEGNGPASLLLIDIDHFKRINDSYGHLIGDQAITFAADLIQDVFHEKGIVGRFGGEEFIVYLEGADKERALEMANTLLEVLHRESFPLDDGSSLFLTVSIGFCTTGNHREKSLHAMIESADTELYKAKHNGRDQVSAC
ncbi:GGDEF domain-containing protein [Bacillus sp. RO3]|nr:GGDEF domain-containing protein [Bacillus sp. RO3]